MTKEYIMQLEATIENLRRDNKILKEELSKYKAIDNTKPSEAMDKLEGLGFGLWNEDKSIVSINGHYFKNAYDTIKQALIKVQEQEKLLKSGDLSDGYHTFNQLYYQRCILFASLVRLNKDKSWKSFKHSDGKYCFDSNGEWFIVGIDTPIGSYTYHYEKKYWELFECQELECGKEWDGHTEDDVTRLLSLSTKQEEENGRAFGKDIINLNKTLKQVIDKPILYASRYGNKYIVPQELFEEQEKVLEIVFKKRIDLESFYTTFIENDYDYNYYEEMYGTYGKYKLTEEEFNLLKELV